MANIHTRENPALSERLFADIQQALAKEIGWLDNIYGKAERVQREIKGKRYYEPTWYKGRNDYETLIPSKSHLGNYCFFVLSEPQNTAFDTWGTTKVTMPFSLIVWCDVRTTDPNNWDTRNTEYIKEQLLTALNGMHHFSTGHFTITRIYERAENVFAGFTLDETDNQFMMSPYAAFRFDGEIIVHTLCVSNTPTNTDTNTDTNTNTNTQNETT